MKKHVASSPELVQKVKGIFLWNITKGGKTVAKWSKLECFMHVGLNHYFFIERIWTFCTGNSCYCPMGRAWQLEDPH